MKSFSEFVGKRIDEAQSSPHDPPAVLIMRRKAIRLFPNGQKVALYQVDKLNKYVTLPYNDMQWSAVPVNIKD